MTKCGAARAHSPGAGQPTLEPVPPPSTAAADDDDPPPPFPLMALPPSCLMAVFEALSSSLSDAAALSLCCKELYELGAAARCRWVRPAGACWWWGSQWVRACTCRAQSAPRWF